VTRVDPVATGIGSAPTSTYERPSAGAIEDVAGDLEHVVLLGADGPGADLLGALDEAVDVVAKGVAGGDDDGLGAGEVGDGQAERVCGSHGPGAGSSGSMPRPPAGIGARSRRGSGSADTRPAA